MTNTRNRFKYLRTLQLLLVLLLMPNLASAQGLESKLSEKADFVPSATSAKEPLYKMTGRAITSTAGIGQRAAAK